MMKLKTVLKRSGCSCFTSSGGTLTGVSQTPRQFKNMHSSKMVRPAMATSGLRHKDETHRGKEARTYLRSSVCFFFVPQLLTGYLQMRWCKSHSPG